MRGLTPMLRAVLVAGSFVLVCNHAWAGRLISLGANTQAGGVNLDGSVVVGSLSVVPGEARAFRWTESGGAVDLGLSATPGDFPFSMAGGVSEDGSVIVGFCSAGTGVSQGFRWTAATGIVPLGSLPGENQSRAYAVSGDGKVIVGSTGAAYSFRWTQAGGMVALDSTPGNFDRAKAVNFDGSVVVGQDSGIPTNHGFRWTAATGSVLIDPPGQIPPSDATAVSSDGTIMAGLNYALSGGIGYRWTAADGFVSLNGPGDPDTSITPTGIDGNGDTIVGNEQPLNGEQGAFMWDSVHGMRTLASVLSADGIDLSEWKLTEAVAISADGTVVVGNGLHNGNAEGFYAVIAPEPSSIALLGMGLLLMGRRARAKDDRKGWALSL